ncbi:MAG: DUF433 domain-containing protein [Chloroflexi bacterium]|nr:MAG: DUF433 domain-containing protein [Chloroflexota bacterium]
MKTLLKGGVRGKYAEPYRTKTETDTKLLERISTNPKVMAGKPVIRSTRLTVEFILNLLAHGASMREIIAEYQGLTTEDIQACILFSQNTLPETTA